MTDKLPKAKRSRLLNPPAAEIPEAGKVAEVTTPEGREGWRYTGKAGDTGAETSASLMLHPAMSAGPTVQHFNGYKDSELHGWVNELHAQVEAVNAGDLSRAEGMLVTQAHALDAIFHALARRAHANMGEYLETTELYLRLAFKAQSQCRATLETLGQIKNPPNLAFVRQANIAHGPQQINNGQSPARAGEIESSPTKVLEDQRGKWLDPGAQEAAGRLNQALAAMGAVNRPEIPGGQGEGQPQRLQGRDSAAVARDGASVEGPGAGTGRVLTLRR